LYCSRGGLRSKIAGEWIFEDTGKSVARLQGGYKAFRNYLLEHLRPEWLRSKPIILGGRTGSGKTNLLAELENGVDLEKLAHHRGSSFGQFIEPQPGQADFENRLAYALIKHEAQGFSHIILEDEGRHVGKRFLPKALADYFSTGTLVFLETPLHLRTQNTFAEYVIAAQAEYEAEYGQEQGLERWVAAMNLSVGRIGKRLGGKLLQQVRNLLEQAHEQQIRSGSSALNKQWIELLLSDYYDPMYDYQIEKKRDSIVFTGDAAAVLGYLQSKK
jgi:tRNA 2-selenouridine synthase